MSDQRLIRIDDFDMWVETSGAGPPLVLLTSSFASTTVLQPMIAALAVHFTVHAFDARGAGRSGFGTGPITYARQAADAVALLDALSLPDAHFHGHSDGGCIALHLLFDYPHRVCSAPACAARGRRRRTSRSRCSPTSIDRCWSSKPARIR